MPNYRQRFLAMIAELSAHPALQVSEAKLGAPTPRADIALAHEIAGAAWPDGMSELYAEVGSVDIEWRVRNADHPSGAIHIPPVRDVFDYEGLKDELWFDWDDDGPFHHIRPIDRFVPEAYAVLYPIPSRAPAKVHYHYCGESLVETELTYRDWLEALFVTRGVSYWLDIFTGPATSRTWVEEGHEAFAKLFPDFDPSRLRPTKARGVIY